MAFKPNKSKKLEHIFLDLYTGRIGSQSYLDAGRLEVSRYIYLFASYHVSFEPAIFNGSEWVVKKQTEKVLKISKPGKFHKVVKLNDATLQKRETYLSKEVIKKLKQ